MHPCAVLRVKSEAEEDVIADRDRQGIGALEHHADLLADLRQLDVFGIDILVHDVDRASGSHIADALVDAIDAAQEGGLATAGWTDQRRDHALLDGQVDVVERLEVAIPKVQIARVYRGTAVGGGWVGCCVHGQGSVVGSIRCSYHPKRPVM
jgi:hypothetical protein